MVVERRWINRDVSSRMRKWKEYLMRTDTLPDTRVHLLTYTSDKYSDEKVLRRNVFSVYDIHSRVG